MTRAGLFAFQPPAIGKEHPMKLNSPMIDQTLSQFAAQAIPEHHPVLPQLIRAFGNHTFFLNGDGLHIVEPRGPTGTGATVANVIKLASWQDEARNSLAPHEPETTDVVVELGSGDPDAA